jgi:transposase InsO family protein
VSDNGSQFLSDEFATLMKRNGIKNFKSAPYHPATNGVAYRL